MSKVVYLDIKSQVHETPGPNADDGEIADVALKLIEAGYAMFQAGNFAASLDMLRAGRAQWRRIPHGRVAIPAIDVLIEATEQKLALVLKETRH